MNGMSGGIRDHQKIAGPLPEASVIRTDRGWLFESVDHGTVHAAATIRQSVAQSGKVRFSPAKTIKAVKKGSPPCIVELFRAERLLLCRRGGGKNAGPKASAIMESLVQACLPRGNTFVVPLAHLK